MNQSLPTPIDSQAVARSHVSLLHICGLTPTAIPGNL